MKKILLSLVAAATLSFSSFGQAPEGFKYQAVVRDAGNIILNNQAVGLRMTIQQGSIGGTTVYAETFAPTTNAYGLVNLEIGNGTVVSGTFTDIDWAAGPFYIETAVDVTGGTNYSVMGTSQLMSAPYALYAKTSGNGQGPAGPQGPAGEDGTNGLDGAAGPQGAQGLDGINGLSAYQVWIDLGNTGTETDFINSLTGPQGAQGIQGLPGTNGAVGATGPQGIQGIDGPQGPVGNNGTNGANGFDGNGIASTTDNGDGTFTLTFDDGSTFITSNLTGPQGAAGAQGPAGANGTNGTNGLDGNGIASTTDNGDGTFTLTFDDGSTFVTSNLTGPQGAAGAQGAQGAQGPAGSNGTNGTNGLDGNGIASTTDNGDGTFTLTFDDGSTFITSNLTGPQGAAGATGAAGQGGVTSAGADIAIAGTGTVADPYIVSSKIYAIGLWPELGGYVFWVSADGKHGLVAETIDQGLSSWYEAQNRISNPSNHSANGQKFRDWRMPTKYEFSEMYLQRVAIGGFSPSYYWSSTENGYDLAFWQYLVNGAQSSAYKPGTFYVRSVRAF